MQFKGLNVNARMYDIEVTGYNNKTNKLHLFDIDSVDESIVEDGIDFNKNDIEKNLTLFLYRMTATSREGCSVSISSTLW